MPELPEVETIKSQLSEYLPLTIKQIVKSEFVGSILKVESFKLNNKTIKEIKRYGKFIIFGFDDDAFMLSHLGMSGTWLMSQKKSQEKHIHLRLKVLNLTTKQSYYLEYYDPRRFGNIYIINRENLDKKLATQGVDISTKKLNLKYTAHSINKFPHKEIKRLLLDQRYFAGVGNYLASEICAHARVRPDRLCHTINDSEILAIHKSIKKVINKSIKSKGTTFQGGYKDTTGNKGEGVKNLVVFYQKICGLCRQNEVTKTYIDGRGTYYCSKCQQ